MSYINIKTIATKMDKVLMACGFDQFIVSKILDMKSEIEHRDKMRKVLKEIKSSVAFALIYNRMCMRDNAQTKWQAQEQHRKEFNKDGFVLTNSGLIACNEEASKSMQLKTYKRAGYVFQHAFTADSILYHSIQAVIQCYLHDDGEDDYEDDDEDDDKDADPFVPIFRFAKLMESNKFNRIIARHKDAVYEFDEDSPHLNLDCIYAH